MESNRKKSTLFVAVILTSGAVLMLEIGLTRVFSILFDYHFSFLAVSMALMGLGLGGVFFQSKLNGRGASITVISSTGTLFAGTLLALILLITVFSSLANFYLIIAVAFLPFFFAGIFLSFCFMELASSSGKLYALDLLGAAMVTSYAPQFVIDC